jgi:hypothetical protein
LAIDERGQSFSDTQKADRRFGGQMLNYNQSVFGRQAWRESFLQFHTVSGPMHKRRPYLKHMDHVADLDFVFDALTESLPRGAFTDLIIHADVPSTTLCAWDEIPEDAIHSAWDIDKAHSWDREGTMVQPEGADEDYLFTVSTGDRDDQ